jgi:hypothetical protein
MVMYMKQYHQTPRNLAGKILTYRMFADSDHAGDKAHTTVTEQVLLFS